MVQKVALDQTDNRKIAFTYRILREHGYINRVRIYDLDGLDCERGINAVTSEDDIEEAYEAVRE